MDPQIDLQDWEFLNDPSSSSKPEPNPSPFEDSDDGAIKPDYFSLNPTAKPLDISQEPDSTSVGSDNPSWIDPESHSPQARAQFTASFWSDEDSSEGSRSVVGAVGEKLGFEKEEEEEEVKDGVLGKGSRGDEEVKVWWKVPVEILKLWIVRAKPVWSCSIAAAAIIGAVMLGRRLMHKMKQKSKGIPLKIAMDDKKASQFMSRVARLNEAFSVVKRVPVVRPSLPPGGITPWSMASLI